MNKENQIIDLYESGKSVVDISALLNLGRSVIYRVLRNSGAEFSYRKNLDIEFAKSLYLEEHLSTRDVARRLGVSQRKIYLLLSAEGVIDSLRKPKPKPKSVLRRVDTDGYWTRYCPEHPNATSSGWILEHRMVMSERIGRPLAVSEVVHHINGDRMDNRPENLKLYSSPGEHTSSEHLIPKSNSDLLDDLGNFFLVAGRPIKRTDFITKNGLKTAETYRVRFGGWTSACKIAGVPYLKGTTLHGV